MLNTSHMAIEVFKTNVQKVRESKKLAAWMNGHFPQYQVHFDLEDCDKVLRVEAPEVDPAAIIALMARQGFHCEVLD